MLAASITPTGPERTGYADAPGGRIWWRMDGVRHLRSQRVPLIGNSRRARRLARLPAAAHQAQRRAHHHPLRPARLRRLGQAGRRAQLDDRALRRRGGRPAHGAGDRPLHHPRPFLGRADRGRVCRAQSRRPAGRDLGLAAGQRGALDRRQSRPSRGAAAGGADRAGASRSRRHHQRSRLPGGPASPDEAAFLPDHHRAAGSRQPVPQDEWRRSTARSGAKAPSPARAC